MVITIKKAGFEDLLSSGDYYLKALIIGDNGAGKTPFAAQWPDPLFALCENGHMSLAMSGTAYADIRNSQDMEQLLTLAKVESRKPIATRKFKTLVIDTIDSYQKVLIQERLAQTKATGLSGWDDWGWLEAKMATLIEGIKGLAMHTVVLMHTKDVEEKVDDSDSTRIVQRARMKGDIKESVYDNFPLIGLVETFYGAGKGEDGKAARVLMRQVRWQPDPKHPILRDQSTRLPKTTSVNFEQADFQQIFDAISGGLDEYGTSEVIEQIGEPDPVVEEALDNVVDEVGPLEKPALPKAAAAKKTTAKKTAAKKPLNPEPETQAATDVADAAVEQPAEEKSAFVKIAEEEVAKAAANGREALEKAVAAQKERQDAGLKPGQEAPKAGNICGSQPSAFAGKYPAQTGCGNPIASDDLASKVGLVRHRTYLCGSCIDVINNSK